MNKNCEDGFRVLMMNLDRLHANIRFADAKAGVISFVNYSLLGILYTKLDRTEGAHIEVMRNVPDVIAMCLLLLSAAMAVTVIWPRGLLRNNANTGLIDARRIANYNKAEFVGAMQEADEAQLYRQTHELLWDLSRIDLRKYRLLGLTVWCALPAWLAALYALVTSHL